MKSNLITQITSKNQNQAQTEKRILTQNELNLINDVALLKAYYIHLLQDYEEACHRVEKTSKTAQ